MAKCEECGIKLISSIEIADGLCDYCFDDMYWGDWDYWDYWDEDYW